MATSFATQASIAKNLFGYCFGMAAFALLTKHRALGAGVGVLSVLGVLGSHGCTCAQLNIHRYPSQLMITMITTAPHAQCRRLHRIAERMPVVLPEPTPTTSVSRGNEDMNHK